MTVEFLQQIEEVDVEDMVFLDESGINLHMAREYGYSPKGKRVFDHKSGQFKKNYTVIGALTKNGVDALMVVDGGTTKNVFQAYVKEVLLPTLQEGQIIILDNLSAHKNPEIIEMLGEAGVEVIYTPPYSPEWNPIEWAWSKIKSFLRTFAARSLEDLSAALVQAADLVSSEDAINWFKACGYSC